MKSFPSHISVLNRSNFPKEFERHILEKLREDIYSTILSDNPENFYDLSSFKFYSYKNLKNLVGTVREEIEAMGWKTTLSYGGTALFIYSGDVPQNCW